MHDLIPLGTTLPGALTTAEIDRTMEYADAEKALATRAAYASDWRDFAAWCALRGATALPAHQGIVAAYLSNLADSGRKASTIGRRAAAIGYHHKMAGHEPPTGSEAVKAVLRGIRRTIGSAKQGKAPATADLIGQMIALCPDNMIGKRDRALLCLGFAGAFRRSELCALEVADFTEVADGLRILIRRSKGDQEGQGQEVAIPRGYKLRPVEAVQTWLAAAEISSGPVFRAVTQAGRLTRSPRRDTKLPIDLEFMMLRFLFRLTISLSGAAALAVLLITLLGYFFPDPTREKWQPDQPAELAQFHMRTTPQEEPVSPARPTGPGFYRLTVLDADDAAVRATVQVRAMP